MAIFNKIKTNKAQGKSFDDIVSVVILERTQLYDSVSDIGFGLSGDFFEDLHIFSAGKREVPAGSVITFSVTYNDGSKEIIEEKSGTSRCNRLLQLALDSSQNPNSSHKEYKAVQIEKNQLPNGRYLIGKDIPVGTFDFVWIFGRGSIAKFENDHDTTVGATTYFQYMGNKYDYEYRQCLNVECKEGELLKITGNIIVEISRSRTIQLDL